ncbi:MAG: type II toxin-antitoxin system VapC family toxin [Lentisphaerae bacterium]|nr:type II toxin-antitoxin system VapC family toxin [Lentisphaerota bacterium]
MKLFLDSSAFAKRFVEEPGSQQVEDLCSQATELCLSVICVPEIIAALNRRLREKRLSRQEYIQAKQRLAQDVRDVVIINLTSEVIHTSVIVLETKPVRAMDALHIACALEWHADWFVSSDRRQITAARSSGLRTKQI